MEHSTFTAELESLGTFHPALLWGDIAAATAAVWTDAGGLRPLTIEVENVRGIGSGRANLIPSTVGLSRDAIQQARHTFEIAKLVEFAAIGVTALALHYLANHEIRDVTARGSGADYLVDEDMYLLEIAGRSRKADLTAAWHERKLRLAGRATNFFLSVVEFETPAARLAFFGG